MYCGKCGKYISDIDEFCPYCGDKTIRYEKPQDECFNDETKRTQRKAKTIKISKKGNFYVLVLVLLIAIAFITLKNKDGADSPDKAAKNVIAASEVGDIDKIIRFSTYNSYCRKELGAEDYNSDYLKKQLSSAYEADKVENENIKVDYKLTDMKYPESEELEALLKQLKKYDYNTEKVEKIAFFELKTMYDDYELFDYIYCIKVGGRWFVSPELNHPGQ